MAIAAAGIIAMIAVIPPPGSYIYYAGLLLVIMAYCTLLRLRFVTALALAAGEARDVRRGGPGLRAHAVSAHREQRVLPHRGEHPRRGCRVRAGEGRSARLPAATGDRRSLAGAAAQERGAGTRERGPRAITRGSDARLASYGTGILRAHRGAAGTVLDGVQSSRSASARETSGRSTAARISCCSSASP